MKYKKLILAILIPLAVGGLSAFLSKDGMEAFMTLNKPVLNPPPVVFPIVWTILYILMGISSYLVYISDSPNTKKALTVYGIQLFFNFGWSIIFFRFMAFFTAFVWLIILIFLIYNMIVKFSNINKIAGRLQIPYLVWCLFAAYLNFSVYLLN